MSARVRDGAEGEDANAASVPQDRLARADRQRPNTNAHADLAGIVAEKVA